MQILLSIALVTRNRPQRLETVMSSIIRQYSNPFEIIIADDSNSEDCITENKAIAHKYGCKYLSGPQRGLYANRNFVAKQCTGTHIRTMDDDHEFPENHFKYCLEAIQLDCDAIWTIGEYTHLEMIRTLPAPVPGQLHAKGYAYKPENMDEYYGISCGASIYPRSVIDKCILNIEIYKFGIVYLEYGARLLNRGYRIRHLDATYVIHNSYETSAPSSEVVNEAKVFSMFMLSFYNKPTFYNKILTFTQIAADVIRNEYSITLVKRAYNEFKNMSKQLM